MASYGATSLTTLLQMVAHGLGVTLIPEMAIGRSARHSRPEDRALRRADAVAHQSPGLAAEQPAPRRCLELAKIVRGLSDVILPQRD